MKYTEDLKLIRPLPNRLRTFALRSIPLVAALHVYIGWQLLPSLPVNNISILVGILFLALSAILVPLGMFARFVIPNAQLADQLSWLGFIAMGFFSTLLILTLLRSLLLLVIDDPLLATISAVTVIGASLTITLLGFFNARRIPKVVHVKVVIDDLPAELNGFKIVQISDLHVGPTIKGNYVKAIVSRVNALNPDLIAITGDVVDGSVDLLSEHTQPLAHLLAHHGVFLVTGNHEYYSGAEAWISEFTRLGIHCLINEHRVINHLGTSLVIAGVADFNAHHFIPTHRSDPLKSLENCPAKAPRILLAHQPRSAKEAEKAGFNLQISGHTHGGQFWPWNLFVNLQQPFTAGINRFGKLWVYTSRGTGYWGPPKRFGADSETTIIQLVDHLQS